MNDTTNATSNDAPKDSKPEEETKPKVAEQVSPFFEENKKAFEDRMTPAFSADQGYTNIIQLLQKTVKNLSSLSGANSDYETISAKFSTLLEEVEREAEVFYKAARKKVIVEEPEKASKEETSSKEDEQAEERKIAEDIPKDKGAPEQEEPQVQSNRLIGHQGDGEEVEDDWALDSPDKEDSKSDDAPA